MRTHELQSSIQFKKGYITILRKSLVIFQPLFFTINISTSTLFLSKLQNGNESKPHLKTGNNGVKNILKNRSVTLNVNVAEAQHCNVHNIQKKWNGPLLTSGLDTALNDKLNPPVCNPLFGSSDLEAFTPNENSKSLPASTSAAGVTLEVAFSESNDVFCS
jgi:hypothetical protein